MIKVCKLSGFREGPDCPETEEVHACVNGLRSDVCPYHKIVHLDKNRVTQVNADCYPADEIRNEPWFILPPAMEYFYRKKHPEYKEIKGWLGKKYNPESFDVVKVNKQLKQLKNYIS